MSSANLEKRIFNTLVDETSVGPVAEQLSIPRSATFSLNLGLLPGAGNIALTTDAIKQASLSGITLLITNGANNQALTLNKESGAADHSVASALLKELGLKNVGDSAILKFLYLGTALTGLAGSVQLTSNDAFVTGGPLALFTNVGTRNFGISYVGIQASNVTSGSEAVNLTFVGNVMP